jgi:hypothetical protein
MTDDLIDRIYESSFIPELWPGDPFNARVGFGILMLWAIIMLSIGAVAHLGGQSSDYSAFELLAPS